MNLSWLNMGMLGALEAGAISLLAGVLAYAVVHYLARRREDWTHAHGIAWAYLLALLVSAGPDIWHLVYMGVIPLESTVTIQRVLASIHDPDFLGVRVAFEVVGAMFGVMIGWLAMSGVLGRSGRTRRER